MKYYTISIQLYSDDLYPDDWTGDQENVYDLTEEQYEHVMDTPWESPYDIEQYIKETTTDPDCINEAEEYKNGLCELDYRVFDYEEQEFYEIGNYTF